jgi:nicotinamidase-related amidase
MPLTVLDNNPALVLIDMQKGIVSMATEHSGADVTARASELTRAFRAAGLPVVLVHVTGASPGRTDAGARPLPQTPGWPELDQQPSDHLVTKQRWGAFVGTSLHEYLQQRGVTQIFFAGISTSVGVESSARTAYDHGYNVVFVVDAMTDRDAEAHRFSVDKIFPKMGETTVTAEVVAKVSERQ